MPLFGLPVVVIHLGVDVARAQRVHVDAVFAPFQRHGAGHVDQGRLAHAVDTDFRKRAQTGHRRDVDDSPSREGSWCGPLGPRQHAFAHLLRHKERALHIGVKDKVEVLGRHILHALGGRDARVVDQDVDGANLGLGACNCRLDRVVTGHVEFNHMRVATGAVELSA